MTIEMIILIIALILIVGLTIWVFLLNQRIEKLTRGKNGSLESLIGNIVKRNDELASEHQELIERHITLSEQVMSSMQGFGFVKFNPFGEDSTRQSFAVAMIDRYGNGLVLSTLYSRERMSVFSKEITTFNSTQKLTDEETQALQKAKKSLG